MASSSRACISDATLWIDLHAGKLLEAVFCLPYTWVAPDLVVAELQEPAGARLVAAGLQSRGLSGPLVRELVSLRAVYRGVSVADLSALVLAKAMGSVLVTGDAHLRRAAQREGVTVHGTLWVLDELVRAGVMAAPAVAQALEEILAAGGRLPFDECRKRLLRWQGSG